MELKQHGASTWFLKSSTSSYTTSITVSKRLGFSIALAYTRHPRILTTRVPLGLCGQTRLAGWSHETFWTCVRLKLRMWTNMSCTSVALRARQTSECLGLAHHHLFVSRSDRCLCLDRVGETVFENKIAGRRYTAACVFTARLCHRWTELRLPHQYNADRAAFLGHAACECKIAQDCSEFSSFFIDCL